MKALFIPAFDGGRSHQIPTFVLSQRYFRRVSGLSNIFLLPRSEHEDFQRKGTNVLPIDYFEHILPAESNNEHLNKWSRIVEKEKEAYKHCNPDFIVEDGNFVTALLCEKHKIPLISVQRTGFFRSIDEELRNPNHIHSLVRGQGHLPTSYYPSINEILNRTLTTVTRVAKAKIIPGIPQIETLPVDVENPESYFIVGRLMRQITRQTHCLLDYRIFSKRMNGGKRHLSRQD